MPDAPHFDDPMHWQHRADQARVLAEDMKDGTAKKMMLRIARDYDDLAAKAAARLGITNWYKSHE